MRFSELDKNKWPHYIADYVAENMARQLCEAKCRQEDFKPFYNKEISIRHHKMTIALAMPDRIRGKS